MPSLSTRSGRDIYSSPTFWVQDLKNPTINGGFASHTEWSIYDVTHICVNDIEGATITTRNASDIEVTSGVVGTHGRQDQPINSPTATQLDKTWINLPAGTYVFVFNIHNHYAKESIRLWNKSDSEVIHYIQGYGSTFQYGDRVLKFSIDGNKSIQVQTADYSGDVVSIGDKGLAYSNVNTGKVVHTEYRFYKIG